MSIILLIHFVSFLHVRRWLILRKLSETAQKQAPEQQVGAVEHLCGLAATTPQLRVQHILRTATESEARPFLRS